MFACGSAGAGTLIHLPPILALSYNSDERSLKKNAARKRIEINSENMAELSTSF